MSRWRGRNDILPRMAIAQHPQLTTDKSAFSPLDKIALQSTPGWRAIYGWNVVFMTFLQHLLL
jgi:hypothetical protein